MSSSQGILKNLQQKAQKNETSQEDKSEKVKEVLVKRSYSIKESTDLKLNQMKVEDMMKGIKKDLQDIVDEAICFYFENRNKE